MSDRAIAPGWRRRHRRPNEYTTCRGEYRAWIRPAGDGTSAVVWTIADRIGGVVASGRVDSVDAALAAAIPALAALPC